jgi:hypothetical protein
MSALEELWLWLQGRSSQTETGPDTTETTAGIKPQRLQEDPAGARRKTEALEARVQRHARYRAGPWQMK